MKKSIFKRIGLIALAVCVAIGSFFVPLKSDKNINAAHADSSTSSYSFEGSSLITVATGYNSYSDRALTWGASNVSFAFSSSNNITSGSISAKTMSGSNFEKFFTISDTFTATTSEQQHQVQLEPYVFFRYYFFVSSDDFNSNIYKLRIWSQDYTSTFWTYIRYYDTNDNYIQFGFIVENYNDTEFNNAKLFMYSDRTYYFITSDNLVDNQLYNQGFQDGLADNQQNIYTNGYNAGYSIGYGNGVTAGRADANDFSFISLIGAVVDVPLQTFLGLFHFELLGINLANFILALLTVAFIIFIIKLILGGK